MASPRRLRRLATVIEIALELPADRRADYVRALRHQEEELAELVAAALAEVESTPPGAPQPAAVTASSDLDLAPTSVETPADTARQEQHDLGAGSRIGPYELLEHLGTGGMGSVYLARRADQEYERTVAIKLIRRGFENESTHRRFLAERQILAAFDHPGIARMYEGGTTEAGHPYLVMEYVEGQRIDAYCDQEHLSVRQRLEIFLKVCEAVEYAHRHLVIHRDLKPSNVLVTRQGAVKLVDFGVAKPLSPDRLSLTADETGTGLSPMTPHYASPEQVRGEPISTRSDVYSLGALLYKLLTGELPIDLSKTGFLEWARTLETAEIVPPSRALDAKARQAEAQLKRAEIAAAPGPAVSGGRLGKLRRQLEGDIDTLVLCALHRDLERRYPSVEALARDVRAHLEGRPVAARSDSVLYKFGKFASRHRIALSLATLALSAVLGLSLLAHQQARSAEQERELARAAQADAEASASVERQVAKFLVDVFETADPDTALARGTLARELLQNQVERLSQREQLDPRVRARLLESVGKAFERLGLYEQSGALLGESLALHRTSEGGELDTARGLVALGSTQLGLGDAPRAEGSIRRALEILETEDFRDRPAERAERAELLAAAHYDLARTHDRQGEHRAALPHFRRAASAVELSPHAPLFDPVLKARMLNGLGSAYRHAQRPDLALEILREADARVLRDLRPLHPLRAHIQINLGQVLSSIGDSEGAHRSFDRALEVHEQAASLDTEELGLLYSSRGAAHLQRGEFEPAERSYRRAEEIFREGGPAYSALLGNVQTGQGVLELHRGRREEAVGRFEEALGSLGQAESPDLTFMASLHNNLGVIHKQGERYSQALGHYDRAIALQSEALGNEHPNVLSTRSNVGHLELQRGDLQAAEEIFVEVLAAFGAYDPEPLLAGDAHQGYGELLVRRGRPEEAVAAFRRSLEVRDAHLSNEHPELQETLRLFADALRSLDRAEEAAALESRLKPAARPSA
ncbi:MAG: serine/threonine-protein kinase [Acidobacteriota bacterium]